MAFLNSLHYYGAQLIFDHLNFEKKACH